MKLPISSALINFYFFRTLTCTFGKESDMNFNLFLPQKYLRGIDWLFISKGMIPFTHLGFPSNPETWYGSNVGLTPQLHQNESRNIQIDFDQEIMVVITPSNETTFFTTLNEISRLYAKIQADIDFLRWKPRIILIWPADNRQWSIELATQKYVNHFLVDSDIYIMSSNAGKSPLLWEIYTLNEVLIIRELKFESTLDLTFLLRKSERRGNFNGALIKVVAVFDPYYHKQCHLVPGGKPDQIEGMCMALLSDFKTALNFTYKVIHGTGWINSLPNGTLTGIGKQVLDGEATFAICHSLYLPYRVGRLTFLQPTEQSNLEIFFIQPEQTSLRDIYFSLFRPEVWLFLALTWVVIVISIKAFAWIENKFLDDPPEQNKNHEKTRDALIWSIGTIAQQGWYCSPTSFSVRIAIIFSLFFGLIMYVAFSASLVSNLSDQRYPIKSSDDLVKSSYRIIVDSGLPLNTTLGSIPESHLTKVGLNDGIRDIITNPSAYITFADGFRSAFDRMNLSPTFYCQRIYRLRPMRAVYHSGTFLKKGSEFKELFNHRIFVEAFAFPNWVSYLVGNLGLNLIYFVYSRITKMKQIGLNNRLNLRYYIETGGGTCQTGGRQDINQLGIHDLFTAFVILILGFCGSLVFLIIEILRARERRNNIVSVSADSTDN